MTFSTTRGMIMTMISRSSPGHPTAVGLLMGTVVLLLVSGCSASQTIALDDSGGGRADIEISVDPVLVAYLSDLTAGFGGEEDIPIFDPIAVRSALESRPGIVVESVTVPEPSQMQLAVRFDSVDALLRLQGTRTADYLRFERTESFRRLAARIDRAAIDHFTSLAGVDAFVRESLLPPGEIDAAEYRDYLAWAFEEYADERPLDRVFAASRIVTTIQTSGDVVQVRGGRREGDGVRFETPLVEAVTADRPLSYALVFTPTP